MRKTCLRGLAGSATVICLLGLLLGMAACESLQPTTTTAAPTTTTAAPTTTEAPVEQTTTTQTTVASVAVTMESGTSYCFVKHAFSLSGVDYVVVDYVVVDYIQVDWVWSNTMERYEPEVRNTNYKRRTFIVPPGAELSFFTGEASPPDFEPRTPTFTDLKNRVAWGQANSGEWLLFGFWEIKVSNGQVVYLGDPERPSG